MGLRDTELGTFGRAFIPMLFLLPDWVGASVGSFVTALILALVTTWLFRLQLSRRAILQIALLMAIFTALQLLILPKTPTGFMKSLPEPYFWLCAMGCIMLSQAARCESLEEDRQRSALAVLAGAMAGLLIPLGVHGAWRATAKELQIQPGMRIIERRLVTIDLGVLDGFDSREGAFKLLA
jgi:hypothetical protein